MDRYQRVSSKKAAADPLNENVIRITSQGLVRNYISYAFSLLQEKSGQEIVLQGMGKAINKAVNIAEIIKRRFPGLYQDTSISSVKITDVWEPLEEGLCNVEQTRNVSMISITLCTKELNKTAAGYQAPPPAEQPSSYENNQQQPRQALSTYDANSEDLNVERRGRARGPGFYSRGRYQNYQENARYSNQGQGGGRGGSGYIENEGYQSQRQGGGRDRGSGYNENEGYQNQRQGGGRGRGRGYYGNGNGRGGRVGGGRGYGGGRGQVVNRSRGGDNQA